MPWIYSPDLPPAHHCQPPEHGPVDPALEAKQQEVGAPKIKPPDLTPGSIWQCDECYDLWLFEGWQWFEGMSVGPKWKKMGAWLIWRHRKLLRDKFAWN